MKDTATLTETNFVWHMGDDLSYHFNVKRNLRNRLKWWVSTKLFLPGTYEWK